MKFSKKIISISLAVVMLIACICPNGILPFDISTLAAIAEGNNSTGYPLSVSVKTEKNSYSSLNTAKFTVCIENVGNNEVTDISSQVSFDSLQPVGNGSVLYIDSVNLKAGEKTSYTFSATVQPQKLNFFLRLFLIIKNVFASVQQVPSNNFNDGRKSEQVDFSIKFGSVVVTDCVSVWYNYQTEVVGTTDESDFYMEASKLASETMASTDFNMEEALEDEFYSGRVILKCSNENSIDLSEYNVDKIISNGEGLHVLQFANGEMAEQCVDTISKSESVDYVEPDIFFSLSAEETASTSEDITSSDDLSWGETYIKADKYANYLEKINKFKLVTVAVIDTGVDLDHPYLEGRILSSGYDFIDADNEPDDKFGHGTHVAGIITDCTNNLNVKVMPIKVFQEVESKDEPGKVVAGASKLTIAAGINYAVNNGATVINLSLGGTLDKYHRYLDEAVNYAVSKGVVVCVAAGNEATQTENVCPAHIEGAITVGAIDDTGEIAYFSNYGKAVDVVAPGVEVLSSYLGGSYKKLSGTSMATPHVSAVAAMLKLAYPNYSPAMIETLVKRYCDDLGESGRDDYYGNGVVNIYKSIPSSILEFETNGGSSISSKTLKNGEELVLPTPEKNYKVTFDANGGTMTGKSVYYRECTLEGWYTDSTFGGTRYAPESTYTVLGSQTLYANWTNPNLGEIVSTTPTRTNYNFEGWYTAKIGGAKCTNLSKITNNITLYAQWKQNTVTMPNVIGNSYSNAKATLEAMGLKVNYQTAYNSYYNENIVYAQSVSANTTVAVGSTVTLTYSLGAKPLAVGDYVMFNGGYLYEYVLGNGVYKDRAWGYLTDVYYWNGATYYQFRYDGNSAPYGWAEASYYTQLSN